MMGLRNRQFQNLFMENTMLENIPSESIMTDLLGKPLYDVWLSLCSVIDEKYDMERSWNSGGKNWTYEYKYRRGGKTPSEKMNARSLKKAEKVSLRKFRKYMMNPRPIMTENGLCSILMMSPCFPIS